MEEKHDHNKNRPEERRALSIDWALYEKMLAESDLPETDKRAFIEALWSVIVSFVDLGFKLSPVAQSCGQIELSDALARVAGEAVIESKGNPSRKELDAAPEMDSALAAEGSRP